MNGKNRKAENIIKLMPITEHSPREFKIIPLRECPMPEDMAIIHGPAAAVHYWQTHIETSSRFEEGSTLLVALLLNARKRLVGHHCIFQAAGMTHTGTAEIELFRAACVSGAASVIGMANHPSGICAPMKSEKNFAKHCSAIADILALTFEDFIIVGRGQWCSLLGWRGLKPGITQLQKPAGFNPEDCRRINLN
jgi:DNA repair protein RadC